MHLAGKPVEWTLAGGTVKAAMILLFKPQRKGLVDIRQGIPLKPREELSLYCFEESFDLPLPLVMWLTT